MIAAFLLTVGGIVVAMLAGLCLAHWFLTGTLDDADLLDPEQVDQDSWPEEGDRGTDAD